MSCRRYVNSVAEKKGFDKQRLLHCKWDDIIPSEEDLVREPLLRELCLWPPPSDVASRDSLGPEEVQNGEARSEGVRVGEVRSGEVRKRGDASAPRDGGVEEAKGEGDVSAEVVGERGAGGVQQPGNEGRGGKLPGKAKAGVGHGGEKKGGCIEARFEVLQLVNRKLADAMPYLDLCQVMRVGGLCSRTRTILG